PVGETDDLVPGRDSFNANADPGHDPGQVATLAGRETGWPNVVKHPFAYFRLAGVDRSSLHLDQHLPLSRLGNRRVDYLQDVNAAIPIKSNCLHAPFSLSLILARWPNTTLGRRVPIANVVRRPHFILGRNRRSHCSCSSKLRQAYDRAG